MFLISMHSLCVSGVVWEAVGFQRFCNKNFVALIISRISMLL